MFYKVNYVLFNQLVVCVVSSAYLDCVLRVLVLAAELAD
jgi:hypothetical protein